MATISRELDKIAVSLKRIDRAVRNLDFLADVIDSESMLKELIDIAQELDKITDAANAIECNLPE